MRSLLSATTAIARQQSYRSRFQARSLPVILQRNLAMGHSVPPLNDKSLLKDKCYVNGEWIGAKSGKTFEVTGASADLLEML
jgi:succinate-semialdehyde dehydrogenase/glutarate-semialdehyde dehydrogenase